MLLSFIMSVELQNLQSSRQLLSRGSPVAGQGPVYHLLRDPAHSVSLGPHDVMFNVMRAVSQHWITILRYN